MVLPLGSTLSMILAQMPSLPEKEDWMACRFELIDLYARFTWYEQ